MDSAANCFKERFLVSLGATIPVFLFSSSFQSFFSFLPGIRYYSPGISIFIFFYGGLPFIRGMIYEVKNKTPGTMTLVGLAISVVFVYTFSISLSNGKALFLELALLIDILLVGHWIDATLLQRAGNAERYEKKDKSVASKFLDRTGVWITVAALISSGITLIMWLVSGQGFAFSIERMVTVMIIACPHAPALAIPLVMAVLAGITSKHGMLVRNRSAFENARKANLVVFELTGTLTRGEFKVTEIISTSHLSETGILRYAASIGEHGGNLAGKSIVREAIKKNLNLNKISHFQALPGAGYRAEIGGVEILVGNRRILENVQKPSRDLKQKISEFIEQGKTILCVASRKEILGIITLSDTLRDESKEVIATLKKSGRKVAIITDNTREVAEVFAKRLDIDLVFANLLPWQKAETIEELKKTGKTVALIGNRTGDSPALSLADTVISIGFSEETTDRNADILLFHNNLRNIPDIFSLSDLGRKKVTQNFLFASAYNLLAIPVASGMLYHYGIIIAPTSAAFFMSLSVLIVLINSRSISFRREV